MNIREERRGGRIARALSALLIVVGLAVTAPPPALAEGYPSWDDVLSAQGNEDATRAQVARIESALADAQSQAAAASRRALDSADSSATARSAAEAAATRADLIDSQADAAEDAFIDARERAATIATGRYRSESTTPLTVRLLTTADPDELLTRLSTLERLDSTWSTIARASQASAAIVSSLTAQAQEAERARTDLAAEAERAAGEARTAAANEASTVTGLQGHVDTLYAQLATLRNTSADVERRFRIGQEVAEQERQAQEQAARAERERQEAGSGTDGESRGGSASGGSGSSSGGSAAPDPGTGVIVDPADAQAYARDRMTAYGWSSDQFECLRLLWNRESGWRANALNPGSGAYGIPQSLPGEKMAAAGPDWRTNGRTQVDWGLGYIADRYGAPCGAWAHSEATNWY